MDEYQGHLRLATTTGRVPSPEVYSTVSVLAEKEGRLEPVGQVDNIAPGEDIQSVRFNGSMGFLVTFKKTDPLFVLDLSVSEVKRSIFMDDYVYAVALDQIDVAPLQDLAHPVARVSLER